jgi:DNA-binding transcriptional LysR family regulator
MDRLQSMRVFAKVVEQGSFARAGSALEMSNAVVTRHVADLEQHLGTRLLNRTTRKLSLTETGNGYLDRVRQILSDIDEADAAASAASCKASGTLRLYCHPNFGQSQLAKLLPRFAAAHPDVVLDVTLADRTVDLVEDGYDAGIFIGVQKVDGNMIARPLGSSTVILTASPDYVRRRGAPLAPKALSDHDCLNHSFDQMRHHAWRVQCNGKEIRVPIVSKMISNSNEVLRQAALAGMGIMLRTSYTLGDDLSTGKLVQLLPEYCTGRLEVLLVYPSRKLVSAKVRAFVDFMTQVFPDPAADPWLSAL